MCRPSYGGILVVLLNEVLGKHKTASERWEYNRTPRLISIPLINLPRVECIRSLSVRNMMMRHRPSSRRPRFCYTPICTLWQRPRPNFHSSIVLNSPPCLDGCARGLKFDD